MTDIVNERVNEAEKVLLQRAKKLESLVNKAKGKKVAEGFKEGVNIVSDMINGHVKMIETMVFDEPKTALEQTRNLALVTGGMNKSPAEHLKSITDPVDTMLATLEGMIR